MRQYKMWYDTYSPDYKNGNKSYGSNSYTTQRLFVGTSSANSYPFCTTEMEKIELFINDTLHYKFVYTVDGEVVKEKLFNVKTKEIVKDN